MKSKRKQQQAKPALFVLGRARLGADRLGGENERAEREAPAGERS